MSLEIAKIQHPEEERPATFRGNRKETYQDGYCQSILPLDEIARDNHKNEGNRTPESGMP